jgi:hypothetical protein
MQDESRERRLMAEDASQMAFREANMFQRFASGSSIAAIGIAFAIIVVLLVPAVNLQRVCPPPAVWCFAPAVWGLWAMLAPRAWVPERLPLRGAILGVTAGTMAAFVLDLPSRIAGRTVAVTSRRPGFVVVVVLYFLKWMVVRVVYRSLSSAESVA